jgi:enoyl-CoA hydratase
MDRFLDVERRGPVSTVLMHRGEHNAISDELMEELETAFGRLGADPEVRAVVLASKSERYFSVGADLTAMAEINRRSKDAEDQILTLARRLRRGFDAVASCPKPVIAAIKGHALGGGCELALCCDYRVMVEDGRSWIGQTESGVGIMPGAGGTQRLIRLIGRARALPLLYEGTRIQAQEAAGIGLVSRAVAPDQFDASVSALAEQLARGPTLALGLIKDAVNRGQELPMAEALEVEARNFARSVLSEDAAIGIMSFFAKQEPEFQGR